MKSSFKNIYNPKNIEIIKKQWVFICTVVVAAIVSTQAVDRNLQLASGETNVDAQLVINEFMADNDSTIQDPCGTGYPDWIELYNAGANTVELGGMYLTDDMNDPTMWMIPPAITGSTLREEIANRLSGYTYPPSDMILKIHIPSREDTRVTAKST